MLTIASIYIKHYLKNSIKTILVLIPFFVLVFLYRPHLSIGEYKVINPIYNLYEWWVLLIIFVIGSFLFIILVTIFYSVYYSIRRSRREIINIRVNNYFVPAIVDYLYSKKYQDPKEKKAFYNTIKKFTRYKENIEAFYIASIRVQKMVTYDNREKMRVLFNGTGLTKKIDKFFYSFDLSDKIIAIKIISYLQVINQYLPTIEKYAKSRNIALRTEAHAALIRLKKSTDRLSFIISDKHKLTFLDINVIVNNAIRSISEEADYYELLSSSNKRKVVIGLLLAKKQQKISSRNLVLIINLLGSTSHLVKKMAWETFLSVLSAKKAVEVIMDRFNNETEEVKLIILKKSYNTRDNRFYKFLMTVISNDSLLIKIEAMKILLKEKFEYLSIFINSDDPLIKMAYEEISDLNI